VADQTGSGTLTGTTGDVPEVSPYGSGAEEHHYHHGRPISWVGVSIVIIGFVIGGIAFVPNPKWWLVWIGGGVAAVGLLILGFARTFDTDWY
jgi:hypothetical protein